MSNIIKIKEFIRLYGAEAKVKDIIKLRGVLRCI